MTLAPGERTFHWRLSPYVNCVWARYSFANSIFYNTVKAIYATADTTAEIVTNATMHTPMPKITEFRKFPKLPAELQTQIWKEALNDPTSSRHIVICQPRVLPRPNRVLPRQIRVIPGRHLVHPLLLVNKESRYLARQFYNLKLPVYRIGELNNKMVESLKRSHLSVNEHWIHDKVFSQSYRELHLSAYLYDKLKIKAHDLVWKAGGKYPYLWQ